jgi:hypothetical protein
MRLMKPPTESGLPEGTTWLTRPEGASSTDEGGFCLLSRGDRVWGRCRPSASDRLERSGVIFLSPDGDSEHGWVTRAFDGWSNWATIASLDLPLCGRRRSEKLSAAADDPGDEAGRRLQPYLARQLQEDLGLLVQLLGSVCRIEPDRIAVVAVGSSVARALPCVEDGNWPPVVVLAPPAPGISLGPSVRSLPLPEAFELDAWLEEVGSYLRTALGLEEG